MTEVIDMEGYKEKACWYCLHNGVSDLCADCLRHGDKRAWEYGTWDDRIKPDPRWTPEDQERYLGHLMSIKEINEAIKECKESRIGHVEFNTSGTIFSWRKVNTKRKEIIKFFIFHTFL